MKNCKQIVFGIQPATNMFRLPSLGGVVVDAILEKRDSSKILGADYYNSVSTTTKQGDLILTSEGNENILQLHKNNIVFKKTYYDSTKHFNFEKALSEFREIWKVIDRIISVKNIRRIGIAAESRFPVQNPSLNLLRKVTKLDTSDHCDRFSIHYEKIRLASGGFIPDRKKSDFVNVITDIYDSTMDTEHDEIDSININVDVQRFYAPLTNANPADEVMKLYKVEFIKAMSEAQSKMLSLELIHG